MLKLSEAVRLGSLLVEKPQAGNVDACAIGMAVKAVGKFDEENAYRDIVALWPWINGISPACPVCRRKEWLVNSHFLWHVFDNHVMRECSFTIDQLADWIATIEPKEETVWDVLTYVGTMEEAKVLA